MGQFVNLTGEPITFREKSGSLTTIQPSGQVARLNVRTESKPLDSIDGIPAFQATSTEVVGLPAEQEFTTYIVAVEAAIACPADRVDVFFQGTPIEGVASGLVRFSRPVRLESGYLVRLYPSQPGHLLNEEEEREREALIKLRDELFIEEGREVGKGAVHAIGEMTSGREEFIGRWRAAGHIAAVVPIPPGNHASLAVNPPRWVIYLNGTSSRLELPWQE